MNSINKNGGSICPTGEERYVYFDLTPRPRRKGRYCQYDYRHTDGELFGTVAPTLEQCRAKRDIWLADKIIQNYCCPIKLIKGKKDWLDY